MDVALTEVSRPWLFISALSVAALLLAAAPAAASPAADPEDRPASVKIHLPANHGLHAYLEADEEIELLIRRRGRLVSYTLEGEATEAGLKARFGKLGLFDVSFEPTRTLKEIEPPKGCTGEPSTNREGVFVGTIEFTGQRKYVRIEATRVKGRMFVNRESEWECPKKQKRPRGALRSSKRPLAALRPSTLGARERAEAEGEVAVLAASSNRCSCYFAAFAFRDPSGPTFFVGAKLERREGMEIVRTTFTRARSATFVFDHAAGTARVRPPGPFTGTGPTRGGATGATSGGARSASRCSEPRPSALAVPASGSGCSTNSTTSSTGARTARLAVRARLSPRCRAARRAAPPTRQAPGGGGDRGEGERVDAVLDRLAVVAEDRCVANAARRWGRADRSGRPRTSPPALRRPSR